MDSCLELSESNRCSVVAPAGCGKTHLIAKAVANHARGRELVLTHTHAGVDALRRKLRELGARSSQYHVDTIAGWALRYAAAYPSLSGISSTKPKGDDWKAVYSAASLVLDRKHIRAVVNASYQGLYVDEYQDCTQEQHKLVLNLSAILPTRVLGDPLQGIFGFKNNVLVDWKTDVVRNFEALSLLETPWRWKNTSPALGDWLLSVRQAILDGSEIDLRYAPKPHVRWVQMPVEGAAQFRTQMQICRSASRRNQTTIAIHQWEAQCNRLVNNLAPLYSNIETIECDDLMKHSATIGAARATDRIDAVVDFVCECFTGVRSELKTVIAAAKNGTTSHRRQYKYSDTLRCLLSVRAAQTLAPVLDLLTELKKIQALKLWRRELFFAMCQSIREFQTGEHACLEDAAWAVRTRTRRVGRRLGHRAVGRTLLVKGMEFDHCVLLDADSLKAKDLYVALTRGSRTLTVLSKTPRLRP